MEFRVAAHAGLVTTVDGHGCIDERTVYWHLLSMFGNHLSRVVDVL